QHGFAGGRQQQSGGHKGSTAQQHEQGDADQRGRNSRAAARWRRRPLEAINFTGNKGQALGWLEIGRRHGRLRL
ncbi:MAG TPA: hypothetical protein VK898_17195, partial [Chloroflexota bacterium]|nr:hypothetical protein [Chloroflexota bacterium]